MFKVNKFYLVIVFLIIKILYSTYRFRIISTDRLNYFKKSNSKPGFLFVAWHENLFGIMLSHFYFRLPKSMVMGSKSKDGDFARYTAKNLNYIPIRGSSSREGVDKGGKEAMETFILNILQGVNGSITVDGPKGPRRVCKMGALRIAEKTNCVLVPLTFYGSNFIIFNTWDLFKFPLPFSRIDFRIGDDFIFDHSITMEENAIMLTEKLNSLDNHS